jgi:hypothetical protein
MSSLDRAKKFLASKARTLALAVVPLAAATSTIEAAPLQLSASGCQVNSIGSFSSGFCTTSSVNPGGVDGINWIQIFGDGYAYSFSGGSFGIQFSAFGSGDGGDSPSGLMPLAWDFTISDAFDTQDISYYLSFEFFDNNSGSYFHSESGSGLGRVTGKYSLAIPNSGIISWSVNLVVQGTTMNGEFSEGSSFFVDIPEGTTIDLNPVDATVPEPSSLLLALPGGAYILLRRRRKQA